MDGRQGAEEDVTPPRDLGIALSGGGHRASLFALGALLYLVDSRANERVATICSVSGGSVTNAFVAQECDFGTVSRRDFDVVAGRLTRTITSEGIVSLSSWVVRFYTGVLTVFGAAIVWFFLARVAGWQSALGLSTAGLLILVFGTLLLLRGTVVAWLLGRAFFLDARGRPSQLGNLRNRTVGHVLCATDLAGAAPFYFLCGNEWAVYSPRYGFARAGAMKLRTAVRASAALPGGIPPKLLLSGRLEWATDPTPPPPLKPAPVDPLPSFLFLADGGVWNNLGTQYFERDRELDIAFHLFKKGVNPSRPSDDPGKLIIVDGSGAVSPTRSWDLVIPLWAEIRALSRVMSLLYTNTVRPRMRQVGEAKRAYWRWGDLFDRDWDVPKVGVSISFDDNPQSGRIYSGLGFPDTPHSRAAKDRMADFGDYCAGIPERVCPTLTGFPETSELAAFCAREGTHLSTVDRTTATALLVSGYLWTMSEMHVAYDTPLVRPFPSEERFARLVGGGSRV
jgi:predicted acylesterase/phospholipase RssA